MRKHFVAAITKLMHHDSDVIFLTGDLGFGSFEDLDATFPGRYYNVGIAEQNMLGVACGLSLQGKKVIIYSIANFPTLRILEQIRNYLLYHKCKVLIVTGGGGFSYGQLGYTHHAIEDVSIMRSLPEMHVFAPYDNKSINLSIDTWIKDYKVAYLRLEKNEIELDGNFIAQNGYDIYGVKDAKNIIICYGTISRLAHLALDILQKSNISIQVVMLYDFMQINQLLWFLRSNLCERLLIIEENSISGGIGEAILSKCLIEKIFLQKSDIFGIKSKIAEEIGNQGYMLEQHQLTVDRIVNFFK